MKPNLIYTLAIDGPESGNRHRAMAKLLAISLLKTFFSGEILVFRNATAPLFLVERAGLREIEIEGRWDHPCEGKFRVAGLIEAERYGKIMYIDADCLALGNVDHLFDFEEDIRYTAEPGMPLTKEQFNAYLTDKEMALPRDGSNSGAWIVRAERYAETMAGWARLHGSKPKRTRHFADQPAWNKLLLSGAFSSSPFPREEVVFPACFDFQWHHWRRAPLCHFCGSMDAAMKLEFMFGAYAMRFFGDAAPLMIDLLEM